MKKILKLVASVVMTFASWYGVYVLVQEDVAFIRFVLLIQAVVWEFFAYKSALAFAKDKYHVPVFIKEDTEEDWDSDGYDNL